MVPTRIRAAAVALTGIAVIGAAPAPAFAADAYPPGVTPVQCLVSTNSSKSQLKVNVNPNQQGKRYYTFRIEKLRGTTWVRYSKKSYKTQGKKETRTVNVPKGTYRVQCNAKYGYIAATSASVVIKK